ncbi:MAG: hypothetical protein AAGF94_07865 [Pseudomonadota bacterium]
MRPDRGQWFGTLVYHALHTGFEAYIEVIPQTLRVAQVRVVRIERFHEVVRGKKLDRKLVGLRFLAQMLPPLARLPHILSTTGETGRREKLVAFHQEMSQLMRDGEPRTSAAFWVVGENASDAANGICQ